MSPAIASSSIHSKILRYGCLSRLPDFRSDIRHSQATPMSHVESSRLPGKNYESLLAQTRLVVCFQSPLWQSICLTPVWNVNEMNDIHPFWRIILPPPKKKSGQVAFLSGEMVPVSGIWRPDHARCPGSGDIWLRKQTPFPPCSGCGSSAAFALIEEVLHISEDPDFQEGPGTEP
jgi:hypothetical protein